MTKKVIVLSILLMLSACNLEEKVFPKQSFDDGSKIWTFIEFHVPEKEGGFEGLLFRIG